MHSQKPNPHSQLWTSRCTTWAPIMHRLDPAREWWTSSCEATSSQLIVRPPTYITWYDWDVLVRPIEEEKKVYLTSPMSLLRRRPSSLSGISSEASLLSLFSRVGSCPTFHKPSEETLDKEHSTVAALKLVPSVVVVVVVVFFQSATQTHIDIPTLSIRLSRVGSDSEVGWSAHWLVSVGAWPCQGLVAVPHE